MALSDVIGSVGPSVGLGTFVSGVLWAILTGKLRTDKAFQEVRADRDKTEAALRLDLAGEKALTLEWQQAYRHSEAARIAEQIGGADVAALVQALHLLRPAATDPSTPSPPP